jgi:hypothetical protein
MKHRPWRLLGQECVNTSRHRSELVLLPTRGVQVILSPRATAAETTAKWLAVGVVAAARSGSFGSSGTKSRGAEPPAPRRPPLGAYHPALPPRNWGCRFRRSPRDVG